MEVVDADIIILVVDASDPIDEMQRKVDTCMDTFNEIGVNGASIIVALNKIDLVPHDTLDEKSERLSEVSADVITISAKEQINLDKLLTAIEGALPRLHLYSISLPYGSSGMSTLSWLHDYAIVEEETYVKDHIEVKARLNSEVIQKLSRELNPSSLRKL